MQSIPRLVVPALALAALLATGVANSASAQTVFGAGGQSCYDAGFNGLGGSDTVSCQVLAPSQLGYPQALMIAPTTPSGATPLQCSGASGPGYTTQGTVSAFSPITGGNAAGYPGCEFQVTSGVVPAGAPVGTELIGLPFVGAAGSIQQTAAVCSDPSCGASQLSAFIPPAPPTFVTSSFTTSGSSQNWWQNNQWNGGHDGDDHHHDSDDHHHDGDDHHGDDGHSHHRHDGH